MGIDNGEGWRKVDGKVGVEADAVEVESWRISLSSMEADVLKNCGSDGRGKYYEGVWGKRGLLANPGIDGLHIVSGGDTLRDPWANLSDVVALDIRVQFLQQLASVFRAEASEMLLFKEKVGAQIGLGDDGGVLNGKLSDSCSVSARVGCYSCEEERTRENEILQRLNANNARTGVDEENMRILQSLLATGGPEAKLSVVLLLFRGRALQRGRRGSSHGRRGWVRKRAAQTEVRYGTNEQELLPRAGGVTTLELSSASSMPQGGAVPDSPTLGPAQQLP